MLHNISSRFELTLLFWFTIFAKVDGFEKFKIVTCSTLNAELGNVTFENQMSITIDIFRIKFN